MYFVTKNYVSSKHHLYEYCVKNTSAAKKLYNASLFRLRNYFTGKKKEKRTTNEEEVFQEVQLFLKQTGRSKVNQVLSYPVLEKIMRLTKNPDFFCPDISMQASQNVVRNAVNDFSNWLASLKTYQKHPKSYTGKPKMPGYCKADKRTVTFTNQDCVNYHGVIKFPYTKETLKVHITQNASLMEVKIKPYYNGFLVLCTFQGEEMEIPEKFLPNYAGIDFGVDNIAAMVTNEGHSLLFQGGAIKAQNQFFNKRKAELTSILTKGKTHAQVSSRQLRDLSRFRDSFIRDQFHKISRKIIEFCLEHKVGTLVLGVNKDWKQRVNLGKVNNQNFVSIPFAMLRFMITYKAQRVGILVIEQEESYTSKASFLDGDDIPVYGKEQGKVSFSGKRIMRGLYRSKDGQIINADLNGAANILRKAVPEAFTSQNDFAYLNHAKVYGFHELNPKCNPVKGIVAV